MVRVAELFGGLILDGGLVDLQFGGCGIGYFGVACCLVDCMWLLRGCGVVGFPTGCLVLLFTCLVCLFVLSLFVVAYMVGAGCYLCSWFGGFGCGCLVVVALLPGVGICVTLV